MKQKECIIIFPVYKSLKDIEISAFIQAVEMTPDYEHVFIAPRSMVFDSSFDKLKNIEVVRFDDHYFESIKGYNRLMLAKEFYSAFSGYDYMLIHQSDAYLFKPELDYWIKKGFGYIGAPWIKPGKILLVDFYKQLMKLVPFIFSVNARRRYIVRNNVGNGGLSLRKLSYFIYVLDHVPEKILNTYLESDERDYNEDVFWSLEAPKVYSDRHMKIPGWREALLFSFETDPEWSYKKTKQQLPFGCHAFERNKPAFWKQFIVELQQENTN
jgi:hypothetical protein